MYLCLEEEMHERCYTDCNYDNPRKKTNKGIIRVDIEMPGSEVLELEVNYSLPSYKI